MPVELSTGDAVVDAYLHNKYDLVRGMSSTIGAAVATFILKEQSRRGVVGDILEIGAFEGRFLVPLCLAASHSDRVYGIDTFDWPDEHVRHRLETNLARGGVSGAQFEIVHRSTASLDALSDVTRSVPLRFIHVDGDHAPDSLARDLSLSVDALADDGVICIDDMVHPEFPFLVEIVAGFLRERPEFTLFAITDREDFVRSSKFFLGRGSSAAQLREALRAQFAPIVYPHGPKLDFGPAVLLSTQNMEISLEPPAGY